MIKTVVIGASYGGMDAIKTILQALPKSFTVPMGIVLHIGNNKISSFLSILNAQTNYSVKEAEEKESVKSNTVCFAPPNYHLQLEDNATFSLSTDKKVNFSRPSIDVLFETASWALKEECLGILLTGSNNDGAYGLEQIKKAGGTTIVQSPETSAAKLMPENAIKKCQPDFILDLKDIAAKMVEICA